MHPKLLFSSCGYENQYKHHIFILDNACHVNLLDYLKKAERKQGGKNTFWLAKHFIVNDEILPYRLRPIFLFFLFVNHQFCVRAFFLRRTCRMF